MSQEILITNAKDDIPSYKKPLDENEVSYVHLLSISLWAV
jgi:hypothetical protein